MWLVDVIAMEEKTNNFNGYKGIFKSTALFGFVQVIRMLVALIKNKIVAVLLGPEGFGIISIYQNIIYFIKTGAGLGVSQSAVKDISEANIIQDRNVFSKVISVTNHIILYTSLFGFLLTLVLAPLLSQWGFNDRIHIIAFCFLSLSVAFEILTENQLAILKGVRHLKALAKASLIGTIVALLTGIPLFFILGKRGIVPSLIVSSISSAIVSSYYVHKIEYKRLPISFKDTIKCGFSMIKMGSVLMMSNLLSYLFNVIILGYIKRLGGVEDVGLYNAGSTLVVSYFGMVTTALNTDYYPRIAAINTDDVSIGKEANRQVLVGLILIIPLSILFVFFSPIILRILYSSEFVSVKTYMDIAIIGVLISIVSNCLGYVFIAKQESKLYLITSIIINVLSVPIYFILYRYCGLMGLGLSYVINLIMQLIIYSFFAKDRYNVFLNKKNIKILVISIVLVCMCGVVRNMEIMWLSILSCSSIMILVLHFCIKEMKFNMGIDILQYVKKYIKK